jgi:ABC-type transporter Mla subunit MlaD/uncharacterized membrane protein YjfL (UPF0719 family)
METLKLVFEDAFIFYYQNSILISVIVTAIIFLYPFRYRKKNKTNIEAANLTVTLGILGTFVGVTLGLIGFDTTNVSGSVPQLLSGLQTAFLTSIGGMFAHIVLKVNPGFYRYKQHEESSEDVGQKIVDSIVELNRSINGNQDTSLYNVLMISRTEQNQKLKELNDSFNDFAQKVVADSTQNLIEALENVIADFNNKITEQFGDNFKELNSAVKSMVDWQNQYKDQIINSTEALSKIIETMDSLDESMTSISEKNETIHKSHEVLQEVIREVSNSISSFSELGESAKNSLPLIEEHMQTLVKSSGDFVQESAVTLRTQYESFSKTQIKLLTDLENSLEQMISDNKERIIKLDEELGNELTKSLTTLGSQLTSLSSHFVEDYRPLTNELKKLVEVSKVIER